MVTTVLTKLTGDLVNLVLNGLLTLPEVGNHRRDALQLYLCPTDLPEQSLTGGLQVAHLRYQLTFVFLSGAVPGFCLLHIAATLQSPLLVDLFDKFGVQGSHICRFSLNGTAKDCSP
jgi:ABC-type uncharacterized transport system YnjBCD permease subunit